MTGLYPSRPFMWGFFTAPWSQGSKRTGPSTQGLIKSLLLSHSCPLDQSKSRGQGQSQHGRGRLMAWIPRTVVH